MRYFILVVVFFLFLGCQKQGCTDHTASNWNYEARKDDGSCLYESRLRFVGHYQMYDSLYVNDSLQSVVHYILNIEVKESVKDTLYLTNLANLGQSVLAINENDSVYIIHPSTNTADLFFGHGSLTQNFFAYEMQSIIHSAKGSGYKLIEAPV